MRKGKMIAQGAHASLEAFLKSDKSLCDDWLDKFAQKKIVVGCDSLAELNDIYFKAQAAGLVTVMITDRGYTEFRQPTETAVAIGPDWPSKIDPITEGLKLL